nr:uncharacterized protein LOC129282154 [Lytechinus pictus]
MQSSLYSKAQYLWICLYFVNSDIKGTTRERLDTQNSTYRIFTHSIILQCNFHKSIFHFISAISGAILDILAIIYIIRTYRISPEDHDPEADSGSTRIGSRTYGRFHNEDAQRGMSSPSVAGSEESGPPRTLDGPQYEAEARYPGGNVPNPFQEEPKDEDVAPEGDAGLSRYPP